MAKTRLNRGSRDAAISFVKEHLTTPAEQKRYDKAIKKAYAVVKKAVDKKYPPADMQVLAKYKQLRPDYCGGVVTPAGRLVGFELPGHSYSFPRDACYRKDEYPAFKLPSGQCDIRNLKTTESGGHALDEFDAATTALREARAVKLRDYVGVVEGARYIEDLVGIVSPLAKVLEPYKSANTQLTVSGEVLDRIANDTFLKPKTTEEG